MQKPKLKVSAKAFCIAQQVRTACSRAINGVPTPTLTLQLSCNELANGEDDVLSSTAGTDRKHIKI